MHPCDMPCDMPMCDAVYIYEWFVHVSPTALALANLVTHVVVVHLVSPLTKAMASWAPSKEQLQGCRTGIEKAGMTMRPLTKAMASGAKQWKEWNPGLGKRRRSPCSGSYITPLRLNPAKCRGKLWGCVTCPPCPRARRTYALAIGALPRQQRSTVRTRMPPLDSVSHPIISLMYPHS